MAAGSKTTANIGKYKKIDTMSSPKLFRGKVAA